MALDVVVEMYDGLIAVTFVELDTVEPTKAHFIEPNGLFPEDLGKTADIIKEINTKLFPFLDKRIVFKMSVCLIASCSLLLTCH